MKYFGLNTSAPSSHNVTNTYILDGGKKKHSVQRWLAAIKCKKTRQLQSRSRSADSGFGTASVNATSAPAMWALFGGKSNC